MPIPSNKIRLTPAIRYLCQAFNEIEGLSISFDHSGTGRKIHPLIVSGLYRITYDLFYYLKLIGTSGKVKVQLIEKRNGLLLLVVLSQDNQKVNSLAKGLKDTIKKVKSLEGEITIDLLPGNELNIIIDIPDHYRGTNSMDEPIRVLITDDHPVMRDCLCTLLRSVENVTVIGVATNGQEAVDRVKKDSVDLVLMDINMPVLNGIEATKYITKNFPKVRVLAITMLLDENYISDMMEAGAHGYISKSSDRATLIEAMESIVAGERYILG